MKLTTLLLSSVIVGSLLGGCSGKDGDPGPAGTTGAQGPVGPSGQNLSGGLFGFVNPVDEQGAPQAKNGVTVTLEGATPITATSDANGRFEFTNVRNGTYNLSYSRAGYGTVRRFGLGHVGGDQPTALGAATLTQIATTVASTTTATINPSAGAVVLNFTLSKPAPANTWRYAVLASSTPTATAATSTLISGGGITVGGSPVASYPGNSIIDKSNLINAGFPSGSTVYLTVYGSPNNIASYTDPTTGRAVYSSLNTTPSNTVAVVVP